MTLPVNLHHHTEAKACDYHRGNGFFPSGKHGQGHMTILGGIQNRCRASARPLKLFGRTAGFNHLPNGVESSVPAGGVNWKVLAGIAARLWFE